MSMDEKNNIASAIDMMVDHGLILVENPVKCTCEEFSKQRALCPVCDADEYNKVKQLSLTALNSKQ